MSGITNPDNGMMENQQAQDLGHPVDEGAGASGASIESPMPRLGKGADADRIARPGNAMPDGATESARREALRNAKAQPRRKH